MGLGLKLYGDQIKHRLLTDKDWHQAAHRALTKGQPFNGMTDMQARQWCAQARAILGSTSTDEPTNTEMAHCIGYWEAVKADLWGGIWTRPNPGHWPSQDELVHVKDCAFHPKAKTVNKGARGGAMCRMSTFHVDLTRLDKEHQRAALAGFATLDRSRSGRFLVTAHRAAAIDLYITEHGEAPTDANGLDGSHQCSTPLCDKLGHIKLEHRNSHQGQIPDEQFWGIHRVVAQYKTPTCRAMVAQSFDINNSAATRIATTPADAKQPEPGPEEPSNTKLTAPRPAQREMFTDKDDDACGGVA